MRYGFVIDNRKCIGCHACTVACKAENDVPLGVNRTWVKYIEKGEFPNTQRLFSVMRCNHCEEPPCVDICPVTALYKRPDGIVDFNSQRCIGCKACTQACPYDALYIDPNTQTAAKCNYCAHRVDVGLEPACVNVCPEHAIISGDLDDAASEISRLIAREPVQVPKEEKGTRPKLFYINGDAASLNPTSAPPSPDYMQTQQASGVGHYARYAEERVGNADKLKMAEQLVQGENTSKEISKEISKILGLSVSGNGHQPNKVWQAVRNLARRVYDVPSKGVLWGWEVSCYVWTKAIASGTFLVMAVALLFKCAPLTTENLWLSLSISLIFLAVTGILLVRDLDKPWRFAYVLLRPQWGSWLVKGGYAITLFGLLVPALAAGSYFNSPLLSAVGGWGGLILAVIVAVYTAFLFAQCKGRDFWQSPVLPLHMLIHAFMAGAAVLGIARWFVAAPVGWDHYLSVTLSGSIVANLIVLGIELLVPHPTTDARLVVKMITRKPFGPLFWGGAIVIGNLVPLCLLCFADAGVIGAAGILALIGIYCTEHLWVRAPQMVPLS